jgi:hypothetical protein
MDADPDFLAFLRSEEARAYDGTLLDEVEAAIKSYNGAEYGDEEEGRSQVVARDVAETADYMLTSVVDAFVASGRVVEFEPTDQADEGAADDATEALHYLYRRKSGFRFIHDWAKAGLLEKIGIAKTCVERRKKRVEGLYHPAMMPDNAIEAQETDQLHPVDGSPMIHAVTLEETAATFIDRFVPLEEFRCAPDTGTNLDDSVYLAHLVDKRISELTEMGFDVAGLDLSQGSSPLISSLTNARDDGRTTWYGTLDRQGANRKVTLNEEYVLYDLNGDGIAERLCVHRVGNTILAIEETDYQPFEYWCPYPMQGRLIGQSLADKTMDIQRVNTVLERNMLDSLYFQTAPGTFIHEDSCGDHTIDDLLTIRPGRLVRYTGANPPIPEVRTDVSGFAMQAIEFKIRQRESRTGITRLNKGVDDDVLNDTARGQAQLMSRGQQMERYIIRNFAEGVARLFMRKVSLLRKYSPPFQIRVDGEYRMVDPSQWPEEMEVNVRVGLGSGSKDERIMYRQMIGQAQAMLKQAGSPIVTDDNLYNMAVGLTRDCGLEPNDLFTEPPKDENGNPIPQQTPPDPKVMALMAQVQVKQQAIEAQKEADAAKIQQMIAQHVSEAQIESARQQMEAALEIRQQNIQAFIDQQQMILDAHKHATQMDNQQKIAKMRPGGKLNK